MNRRSFLALLAGLPFVGQWIPRKLEFNEANYGAVVRVKIPQRYIVTPGMALADPFVAPTMAEVEYERSQSPIEFDKSLQRVRNALNSARMDRLALAEWDRRYQG